MSRVVVHRVPVARGEAVAVDWIAPAAGQPLALWVPGFGSNRRGEKALYFAERFAELSWGWAAVDLRGHGDSDGRLGELTLSRCLADLAAVLDWLPAPEAPRLLIGSSMGAAVVGWHLARGGEPPRGVVGIAPSWRFPHSALAALAPEEREAWERTGVRRMRNDWLDVELGYGLAEDAARYSPEQLMDSYAVPTLVFHGTRDEAVPWEESLDFVQRCAANDVELMLLKGGDHRLTARKALLFETTLDWWRELTAGDTG